MNIQLRRFLAIAMFLIVTVSLSIAQKDTAQTGTTKDQTQTGTAPVDIEKGPGKGVVHVHVSPEEAYIWVNGAPVAHRTRELYLAPGEYTITVYNYGYAPQTRKVTVAAGQHQNIEARLKPAGARVSGPWGRIQIEGVPGNSLVYLNGTTPEFFVGHADEINNNFLTTQQLIVPVGKQELFVTRRGTNQTIWSGPVDVKPGQRLIVYVKENNQAEMAYKDWPEGNKLKNLKRFEAGTASATIAVAPVSAKLATDTSKVNCNQPAKLTWSSENAGQTTLTADNQTLSDAPSGSLQVTPKKTTKYELRAVGPGGVVTQETTVTVDPTVQTSLAASQPDVRFVKVGNTVKEQGSANLVWSASNADSVQIEPIGPVSGNSGSQTIQPVPTKSSAGKVDEMKTYKIVAKNVCGGSDTSTASIHLTGSIEPEVVAEAKPPEMPQTASPLPLLALLGLASLGTGAILQMRRTRRQG